MKIEFVLQEIDARKNAALEGEINELIAYAEIDRIEKYCAAAKDEIRESALTTLMNRYGGKAEEDGVIFERTQSGRYDYKEIREWITLNDQIKVVEKRAQDAYKQALTGNILADNDGVQIAAANYKPNSPSIKLTLKKIK